MRASFRTLRLTSAAATASLSGAPIQSIFRLPLRLLSTETASDSDSSSVPDFDGSEHTDPPSLCPSQPNPRSDPYYRARADEALFGKKMQSPLQQEEERERATRLARSLLEAALEPPDDVAEKGDMVVREEDQMSLAVGIMGPPNAGKSSLTNFMVKFYFWLCTCFLLGISVEPKFVFSTLLCQFSSSVLFFSSLILGGNKSVCCIKKDQYNYK